MLGIHRCNRQLMHFRPSTGTGTSPSLTRRLTATTSFYSPRVVRVSSHGAVASVVSSILLNARAGARRGIAELLTIRKQHGAHCLSNAFPCVSRGHSGLRPHSWHWHWQASGQAHCKSAKYAAIFTRSFASKLNAHDAASKRITEPKQYQSIPSTKFESAVDHAALQEHASIIINRANLLQGDQLKAVVKRFNENLLSINTWPPHIKSQFLSMISTQIENCSYGSRGAKPLSRSECCAQLLDSLAILNGSQCNIHTLESHTPNLSETIIKAIRVSSFTGESRSFGRLASAFYALSGVNLCWTSMSALGQKDLLAILNHGLLAFLRDSDPQDAIGMPLERVLHGLAKIGVPLPSEQLNLLFDCCTIHLWQISNSKKPAVVLNKLARETGEGILWSLSTVVVASGSTNNSSTSVVISDSNSNHHQQLCQRMTNYASILLDVLDENISLYGIITLLTQLHRIGIPVANYPELWMRIQQRLLTDLVQSPDIDLPLVIGAVVHRVVVDELGVPTESIGPELLEFLSKAHEDFAVATDETHYGNAKESGNEELKVFALRIALNALTMEADVCKKRTWLEIAQPTQRLVLWALQIALDKCLFLSSELTQGETDDNGNAIPKEWLQYVNNMFDALATVGFDFHDGHTEILGGVIACQNIVTAAHHSKGDAVSVTDLAHSTHVAECMARMARIRRNPEIDGTTTLMQWSRLSAHSQQTVVGMLGHCFAHHDPAAHAPLFALIAASVACEVKLPPKMVQLALNQVSQTLRLIITGSEGRAAGGNFHIYQGEDWLCIMYKFLQFQSKGSEINYLHELSTNQHTSEFAAVASEYAIAQAKVLYDPRILALSQSLQSLGLIQPRSPTPLSREVAYSSCVYFGRLLGDGEFANQIVKYRSLD